MKNKIKSCRKGLGVGVPYSDNELDQHLMAYCNALFHAGGRTSKLTTHSTMIRSNNGFHDYQMRHESLFSHAITAHKVWMS